MKFSKVLRINSVYVPKGTSIPFPIQVPQTMAEGLANFRNLEKKAIQAEEEQNRKSFFYLPNHEYPVHQGIPPVWSANQVDYTYNVHHKHWVDQLNNLTMGSAYEGQPLDVIVRSTSFDASKASIHTAAAEHFNYCFMWNSIKPWGTDLPPKLKDALDVQLALHEKNKKAATSSSPTGSRVSGLGRKILKDHMMNCALSMRQPGWVWLAYNGSDFLVYSSDIGQTPISNDIVPLACINMQPQAYWIDYPVSEQGPSVVTQQYVENCFKALDWNMTARYWEEGKTGEDAE